MDNVALIFINLIVLAVFGAIFFARGEAEKGLYPINGGWAFTKHD